MKIKKHIKHIAVLPLIFFINTIMQAQNNITVIGGINLSNYSYNDDDYIDGVDLDYMPGLNLMIEKSFSSIILGAGLNQRGIKLETEGSGIKVEGEEKINYITLHSIYPIQLQPNLSIFGGLQLGKGINGEVTLKASDGVDSADETEDVDADEIELDYGLLIGGSFLINESIGIRASYFKGLSNVSGEGLDDENWKNNSLSISLTYNLNL